jgi:hypothetical protein
MDAAGSGASRLSRESTLNTLRAVATPRYTPGGGVVTGAWLPSRIECGQGRQHLRCAGLARGSRCRLNLHRFGPAAEVVLSALMPRKNTPRVSSAKLHLFDTLRSHASIVIYGRKISE